MTKVGIVGLGVMGRTHFNAWASREDAEVVAVCEANADAIGKLTVAGNIEGQAGTVDLTGVTVYNDFDKMLAEAELDAVSITLPTHLHPDFTVKALERGWHVLCEKPMALNIESCNRMIAASKAADKVLMVAQCIRFWPEYAWSKKAIAEGRYGALRAANFYRLGSAPDAAKGSWFCDPTKSGGVTLDLHIHDVDYVHYLLGEPKGVRAAGAHFENGMLGHITTDFDFGGDRVITAEASWMMSQSFGFVMGFRIMLEKATLVYDCGRKPAFQVFPNEGAAFTPELAPGDGYTGEVAHFVELITGTAAPKITPEQARDSVRIALEAARAAEKS